MSEFLASNDWQWRLLRTIVQGVLGVVIALELCQCERGLNARAFSLRTCQRARSLNARSLDLIMGWCVMDPSMRGLVVALVMAVLSPIMAALGGGDGDKPRSRGVRPVGLNGIDISPWQEDLVVSAMGTCDFVIVKATGGAGYTNECFRRHCDETLAAGKLLGCYHYAQDRGYEGSAETEADHFIAAFKPYVGKAIPFLDWEADALDLGPSWAKTWLDRVKAKTGATPGIYTSKSVLFSFDWAAVAKTYPLWVAQYPNYEASSVKQSPRWGDCGEKARASSERCQCLGDRYSAVQKRVNEILGASASTSTSMDVDAMARAVIRGDYGNGEERRRRLGSYYSIVQRRVNEMLS